MSDVRDAYIKALFELSKADPAKWATFVEAFKVYTWSELERMTTSPADVALVAIGMGRRMRELRDEFVSIEAIASKLRK